MPHPENPMPAPQHDQIVLMSRAITTRYRKTIWKHFISAVKQYELIKPHDVVAVCLSGGKDSLLLAVLMSMLEKLNEVPFTVKYLSMDPGYDAASLAIRQEAIGRLGLPVTHFSTDIFEAVDSVDKSPCHVCSAMRRGHLYKQAKKIGCNKIALGHHLDDAVETALMSLFYAGEFKTMLPRVDSENYEGMQLIRPLYLVSEKDIIAFQRAFELPVLTCACRVTRQEEGGTRKKVKTLLADLSAQHPAVKKNIFGALTKVDCHQVLGYRLGRQGMIHSVLKQSRDEELLLNNNEENDDDI